MAGIAGKTNRFRIATAVDGTYNVVAGLKNSGIEINGANLDDSEFGVDWVQRLQGLKDAKISLSGSYRPDDTTGQVLLRSTLLTDADLWARVLPDGTNGFQLQVRVSKFSVEPTVDGIIGVSIELECTGAVTVYTA